VVRNGASHELPPREVVPGDVIRLATGDLVPVDARLFSAKDLFLNDGTRAAYPTSPAPDAGHECHE
jgi:P-type Mg2+ transporter